jgi:hypothetical protein
MGVLAAFALVVGGLAAKLFRWETVQADAPCSRLGLGSARSLGLGPSVEMRLDLVEHPDDLGYQPPGCHEGDHDNQAEEGQEGHGQTVGHPRPGDAPIR